MSGLSSLLFCLHPPQRQLHESPSKLHVEPRGASQSPNGQSRCEGMVRELLPPVASVTVWTLTYSHKALMAFSNRSSRILLKG